MNPLRIAFARLRGLLRRDSVADEIREELAGHLESRIQQYEREGLTRPAAERRARLRVGNLAVHQDRGYDVRGGGVMEAVLRDFRWAWRGVRHRGWRAVVMVLLLGVTLAANTVVFSAADAFVFRVVPYADADSLVVVQRTSPVSGVTDYMSRPALLAWRTHKDLFAGLEAHETGTAAYVTTDGVTEAAYAQRVTPGMFSLLGVMPRWGRPFTQADAEQGAPPFVVIAESLARRLFGSALLAIGRSFPSGTTGAVPPTVIGVMPPSFRFPTAREEIWQPLNLERWPDDTGVRHVARLAAGRSVEGAAPLVADRLKLIPERRGRPQPLELRSLADFRQNVGVKTVFAVLIAAAMCLLLIACANVASLELAAAARRTRDHAIRTALGASRASLIRVGLFEAAILLASSLAVAIAATTWGSGALASQLTSPMRNALANPLDLDGRAVGFTLAIAVLSWLLTALPSVLRASRATVANGLRDDPRVMPASRASARVRQLLMTGQVALTVLLLIGALLYIRTYTAKVGRDIGLDAARVATIEVYHTPSTRDREEEINAALLERLRHAPGVLSLSRTTTFPPSTQSGVNGPLHINGATESVGRPMVSPYRVDPEYFRTMGITAVQGQLLDESSPPEAVVIDEGFARRYWPDGGAVESRFKLGDARIGGVSEFRVVGVSQQLRADRTATPGGDDVFVMYQKTPQNRPVVPLFVAKLDDERRLESITALVRATAERAIVRVDTIEARYARLEGDTRLAAAITSGFGAMAWLVATCGIYAVMAFLVAGRSREIGIRMALGADRADVRRMIFSSALRFVAAGAVIGLAAAALASRLIAAQMFGVTPTDPLTYASVAALVVLTAMAATWWPARRAARVDPAITLRAE